MLVQAARKLFAERSYEKVTTAEIAKVAGVAYGLIAHHFENKRGLYLAVMREIAYELSANQELPPHGNTLHEQIRHALTNHVTYIDRNATGFIAIMRGGLGADPEMRTMIDELRWNGAQRILRHLGVTDPVPTLLRTTMRGWVGYFDEIVIDRLEYHDINVPTLVELAATNLVTSLRTAIHLDPQTGLDPAVIDIIENAYQGR